MNYKISDNTNINISKNMLKTYLSNINSDKIMFLAANTNGIKHFVVNDNIIKLPNNIKEIKRLYPGQKYYYYTISINSDGTLHLTNDNESDVYIIVSKRDFKLTKKEYRYLPAGKLKLIISIDVIRFITEINAAMQGRLFKCEIETNDRVTDIKKQINISNIIADNPQDLKDIIKYNNLFIDKNIFDEINFEEFFYQKSDNF